MIRVLLLVLCLWTLARPGAALPLDSCRVAIEGAGRREASLLQVARALLPHRPGQPVDAAVLQQSRRLLEDSRFFTDIQFEVDSTGGRLGLAVSLRAAVVIENITVSGQRPFFKHEILDVLAIRPGAVLDTARVAAQEEVIRDFYRRNGRRLLEAGLVTRIDSLAGTCVIRVQLVSDRYLRLGDLAIRGNRLTGDTRLARHLRVWRHRFWPGEAGRFQERELADDLADLRRWYRNRGFAEISVSAEQSVVDGQGRDPRIDLALSLHEGPRYRVRITGNRRFGDARLRRLLSLKTQGNRADATLRRDRQVLEDFLHHKGFVFARVGLDAPRVAEDATRRPVVYRIEQGPRVRISRVGVKGAEGALSETLERNILSRRGHVYDPRLALEDQQALENLLLNRGHRGARVELLETFNRDSTRVELEFRVQAGPVTYLETRLATADGGAWGSDSLHHALGLLDRWAPGRDQQVERTVLDELARAGFGRPAVSQALEWNPDSSRVALGLVVDEGPRQVTGQTFFRGNFKTSPRFLARELALPAGRPFSRQALLKAQQRLQDQPVLVSARLRTLGTEQDTVHLVAELEEILPWYLESAAGYHSADGAYLRARGGQRNLFGRARHLWAGGRLAQTVERLEGGLIDPRFLGRRLSASATVYTERLELLNQRFGSRSRGLELSVERQLAPHWHLNTSGIREHRRLFGSLDATYDSLAALSAFEPRNRLALGGALQLDSRDSFLEPRRGWLGSLELEVSHGLDNPLEDYLRSELDLRRYWGLRPGLVLAAVFRASRVGDLGTGEVPPADRLYFLGGSRSVRGYEENLLAQESDGSARGGALALSGSLEGRWALGRRWELALFADQGRLAIGPDGNGWQPARASAGLGLRLQTAIGPLGVAYGWKLDRQPGEDPGRYHFNLGYPF